MGADVDWESIAVGKVENVIARCAQLKSVLNRNDTIPFTDGHIDVYGSASKRNSEWLGRVPVQVKGKSKSRKAPHLQAYQMRCDDLRAYQKDGGAIYFVVGIDPEEDHTTVYYANLSPSYIEDILRKIPVEQETVAVRLRQFPSGPSKIEPIFRVALRAQRQRRDVQVDDLLWERHRGLTVYSAERLNLDAPITLDPRTSDSALEFKTSEGLLLPAGGILQIFPPEYVEHEVSVSIRSGHLEFQEASVRRLDEETTEVRLECGITLQVVGRDGRSISIAFAPEPILAHRMKALEFYAAILSTGVITFDGHSSKYELGADVVDDQLLAYLTTLREHVALLEVLHVDTTLIDLRQVNDGQFRQLETLSRAFVLGEEFAHDEDQTA